MKRKDLHYLGSLFGCSLWIETKDPKVAKIAEDHLVMLDMRSRKLAGTETREEIRRFTKPGMGRAE